MVKQFGGATYLFAVAMREGATTATFNIKGAEGEKKVEVIDEGRTLSCVNGSFKDSFSSWDTHLYRLPP
jgi:hypothetical protein